MLLSDSDCLFKTPPLRNQLFYILLLLTTYQSIYLFIINIKYFQNKLFLFIKAPLCFFIITFFFNFHSKLNFLLY
ncbi:hypothetical protein H8356DRAFT_1689177 [Neocallimastix lanati (nom. inval.)]|nr:hypothetical protein H8356DRAFT_1689177 [Neocallimastix sp. JGI-2020a]